MRVAPVATSNFCSSSCTIPSRSCAQSLMFWHIYSSPPHIHMDRGHCGTHNPTSEGIARSNMAMAKWARNPDISRMRMNIIVPSYFHAITDGSTGSITDDEINEAINVLNAGFDGSFLSQLTGNTTTDNSDWYNDPHSELDMKNELRQGDCDALNIYSTSGYSYLGFASLPDMCEDNKISDGVVIDSNSKPNGSLFPYNEGKTLIHEVGHWLGLYHTFINIFTPDQYTRMITMRAEFRDTTNSSPNSNSSSLSSLIIFTNQMGQLKVKRRGIRNRRKRTRIDKCWRFDVKKGFVDSCESMRTGERDTIVRTMVSCRGMCCAAGCVVWVSFVVETLYFRSLRIEK